ncbi:MAG TPA: RagB/SusD family nutrient uptake outer membrane protein, partial [Pedobacter sp.]
SEAEIYTQILKDLDDAIAKLPNTVAAGRVNKYVAVAMKARVQLYRQQWADAEALSTTIITSPNNYALVGGASYGTIYTGKNSSESLWELQYNATDANNIAFYYYPTSSGGRNEVSTTTSLRDAFETGDVRKEINYSTVPLAKQLKYSQVNPGVDDVMMIRLAEVYLTRAEARAMQNNLDGALTDLNVIRSRAGLRPSAAADQAGLLTAIRQERRLELAHEGHRFFDLRRYNTTGMSQPFRNLFPIPQTEILNSNGTVVQNPGY